MRTVGQILKEERLKKGFTIEQVEKATKIRGKFVSYLEEDDYTQLPAVPYVQGFIKNYSDFLGLRSHTLLALFRRQFAQQKQHSQKIIEEPLKQSKWQLTPNKVITVLVILLLTILSGYFYFQYKALHAPPPLVLESPQVDAVTKEEMYSVYGTTDPDVTLTINKEPVLVKSDGKFYKDVLLTVGTNTLVVEAKSREGEIAAVTRQITRLPK